MDRSKPSHARILSFVLALGLSACTSDDEGPLDTAGTDGSTGSMTGEATGDTNPMGTTDGPPSSASISGTDSAGSTGGPDPSETGEPQGSTGGEEDYAFDDAPPEAFTQVDRMGMPAVNTGVIASKDLYNTSQPTDDVDGVFVSEIVASLEFLHGALDDDLTGAGLTPCLVDDCVAQAAPLVVPDVISIDLTGEAGFPNGRRPADPVMDVTLAVLLLDLSVPGQDATTLAGLPLNPPANDVEFPESFPYFGEPHE